MALGELFSLQPPPVGIDLLMVDGEDYGPTTADMFIGSERYAEQPLGGRPRYAVLLDMVGDRDPGFPVEGYSSRYAPAWFSASGGSRVTWDTAAFSR